MTISSAGQPAPKGFGGRHVLGAMVAFFAVIIAADSVMIYQAVTTFGGLDNANAYRDGLAYNQRIAADAAQAQRGWDSEITLSGAPAKLRVTLKDRDGSPVRGHHVVASVGRPATNRLDRETPLAETAAGVYEAVFDATGEGNWIATVRAFPANAPGADPIYQTRRRLWLAP